MKAHEYASLNTIIAFLVIVILGQINEYLGKLILPFLVFVVASPFIAIAGVIYGVLEIKYQKQSDLLIVLIIMNLIYILSLIAFHHEILGYMVF